MKTILMVLVASCSSMVDAPCMEGYEHTGNECIARTELPDGGTPYHPDASGTHDGSVDGAVAIDAGGDVAVDAAPTCSLDLTSDPDNCGYCGHVCASGLCAASHCSGEPYGHIVAIGHDYAHYHASMARVIGNAVSLGASAIERVGQWPNSTNPQVTAAVKAGMLAVGKPWQQVVVGPALTDVDVLIVDGPTSVADGATWKPAIDAFLSRGGVVIVVEGASKTEHQFAEGAGLFASGDPVDVTNAALSLAAPTDTVADQVLAPYLAEATTVSFPDLTPAVVATPDGSTVVMHRVR